MNLILSGEAAYLVSDREEGSARRHRLRRGSMIWLYPTEDHLLLDPSQDFSMWVVVWTPETVTRFNASPITGSRAAVLGDEALRRVDAILADVEEAEKSGEDDRRDIGISYLLLAARNAHQRATVSEGEARGIHPAVARAARLLRDETDCLTMSELARRAGNLSASRLARLFVAQMGVGIATFRNQERLERFRRRRAAPESAAETLLDAALGAGFGSYAQFHRVYLAANGHPPSRSGSRSG